MLVVHIQISVKPECVEAFRDATIANARESLKEPGVARFDFVRKADDPTQFMLVEAYRTEDAPRLHKDTRHYAAWRDAVAPMMASPRVSTKYNSIHPAESEW